jgi:hypothetical protein
MDRSSAPTVESSDLFCGYALYLRSNHHLNWSSDEDEKGFHRHNKQTSERVPGPTIHQTYTVMRVPLAEMRA